MEAAISSTRVEELLAALVIVLGRAQEKVCEIAACLCPIKCEIAIRRARVPLINLQIAEFATEFE